MHLLFFLKLLLILFALGVMYSHCLAFIRKKKSESFIKFFFSFTTWGLIIIFTLVPSFALAISRKLGFGDNLNTLIFIGFIVITIILFRLISLIEKLEGNITELVRYQSIKDLKKLHDK